MENKKGTKALKSFKKIKKDFFENLFLKNPFLNMRR